MRVALLGLAASNVIGAFSGALVVLLGRPGWRGALRAWAFAAATAIALATALVTVGQLTAAGGPSATGSRLLPWLASLPQALLVLAVIWLPGVALGSAGAGLFTARRDGLAPD